MGSLMEQVIGAKKEGGAWKHAPTHRRATTGSSTPR